VTGFKLKDIKTGLTLSGVEPIQIVSVVATVAQGDALQLIYRRSLHLLQSKYILPD
jgi:hypothetical protein